MARVDAQPSEQESSADVADVREVLRSYNEAYKRRASKSPNGAVFSAAEPNSVLALYTVQQADGAATYDLDAAVQSLKRDARLVLEEEAKHSLATDMAGYAWARAYGRLPLRQPALDQLEWVLQSGIGPGAVTGLLAAGWRALFLAEALSSFNWEHLPTGRAQLERWITYLEPKASAFGAEAAAAGSLSQSARSAFVLAKLGATLGHDGFAQAGQQAVAALASNQRADGSLPPARDVDRPGPSAVIAQFAAAAYAVGACEAANRATGFLLSHRRDRERNLVLAEDVEGKYELSPWIPLGLLAGSLPAEAEQQPVVPRRVRDVLLGRGRRRRQA